MKKCFRFFFIYSFLLACCLPAYCQELKFEHLFERDGLSNNAVLSIHQDREGFIWFGTWEGLNKFDGYNFTVFQPDPNNAEHTLSHNTISDIEEDSKGNLWVATRGGGLNLLDKSSGKVTTYLLDSSRNHYWNALVDIYQDSREDFWISSAAGLAKFDLRTKTFTRYASPEETSMIVSVAEDPAGRLWAASIRNLYLFDRTTGKFILQPVNLSSAVHYTALHMDKAGLLWIGTGGEGLFHLDTRMPSPQLTAYNPGGLINKFITSTLGELYEDTSGFLWLPTSNGLQRVDRRTHQVLTFQADPHLPTSLSNNTVQSILRDNNGHLWVGTTNGINKWTNNVKAFHAFRIKHAGQPIHLEENNITHLLEDEKGILWMGSSGKTRDAKIPGGGLYQFDQRLNSFQYVDTRPTHSQALSSNQFFVPYQDQAGRIWIGTDEALLSLDKATNGFTRYPTQVRVQAIAQDAAGKLWFGGTKGGYIFQGALACFDPETKTSAYYWYDPKDTTGLSFHNISALAVSRDGNIWVATPGGGLNLFNPATGKFRHFKLNTSFTTGNITDQDIRAVYEDAHGILWVGTNQGGLNRFDPKTEQFTAYSVQEGLPSNHIESILEDHRGNLWLGTSKGLSRFNPLTETFRNYSTKDGLPDNSFNKASRSRLDKRLYFGTTNGFVVFHPDSIKDNLTIPPVYITGLKVLEKVRPIVAGGMELPYKENFLSFDFVALDYTAPEKNQYAYQLVGIDKKWVYSGNRRFASYTDLTPGHYTFRVKASNNDGVWNEKGANLSIIIHPPPWRTTWAYIIYGLLLAGGLLLAQKVVISRERLRADLRVQQVESEKLRELDSLKSRFFANISHEFRTPLSIIHGIVQKWSKRSTINEEQKSDYQVMGRNASRLLQLINQLLDLSRLESGRLTLHPKSADVTGWLRAVASSFESLAQSKDISYRYALPLKPLWVLLDADKLEKIVTNLLSNAIKFTPAGGQVVFTATLEENKPENCQLILTVQDTGIGIKTEHVLHIFDRFYQADTTATRAYEGAGIGLALTKELVKLLGGSIGVESEHGQGTSFRVHLPLQPTSPPEIGISSENEVIEEADKLPLLATKEHKPVVHSQDTKVATKNGYTPKVLIIEDNPDLRAFMSQSLAAKFTVLEAKDGQAGLSLAIESIPDLIVSDLMMPGMDGLTLCSKLKTDERTSHIPLILLTAKADAASKLEGLTHGADDYLTKPFILEELEVRIKNLIAGRKQLRERFSKTLTLAPGEITVTSTDERFLQKALSIVETNMDNAQFDIETFGKEIGMSRSQLHRKLSALTGQSPSEFIRQLRLQRAAHLLELGHGNVSEVALAVGFSSLNYFTRSFRGQYGKTPSDYVKSLTKEKV